jgi:predicted permease
MGVPALLGRTVTGVEEEPETKAVLGYQFWANRLAANPAVIGQTFVFNGRPRTIVGVMPARFSFRGADVYLPIHYRAGQIPEGVSNMHITARRRPGVGNAQAQIDLDPIIRDLAARNPANYPPQWRLELITFKETFPSGIRGILWIMFGAVGLLLLIACANVSNLLLARASTRQREMAMRAALGAGRGRLFRQLLTESLLLGLAGGALGVLGSWAALKAILAVVPPNVIPSESEVVLNFPVLGFSFGLCLLTTLLFGLAPALHSTTGELAHPLREAGRGAGGGRRMAGLRGALVVLELSLAIVLLSGAGLVLRTLFEIYNAPLAVGIEGRLVARLPLSAQRYPTAERRAAFIGQALERISAVPGVLSASINGGVHPIWSWDFPVEIPGAQGDARPVNFHQVDAAYLRTTGIGLRFGRWLSADDVRARRRVAVVNEQFVKRYFAGQSPLGRQVGMARLKMPPFGLPDATFEVIGVAQDALHEPQNGEARPELYVPYSILGLADSIVVHTQGDPLRLAKPVREQIYQLDGAQFVDETQSLASSMDRWVYSRARFHLWLMGVFAGVGLMLAVIGVYGLLSQIVAQQRQEFGVRMAIGAQFGDIVLLVLTRGVRLMTVGVAAGVGVTMVLLKYFGNQLGVTDPFDPGSLGGACLVLAGAGLAACLIPAIRAGRMNPVEVLRGD